MAKPKHFRPQVGELVKDETTGEHVVHMETIGRRAYIRPPGGGVERDVDAAKLSELPGGPGVVVHIVPDKLSGFANADCNEADA
ncbi:hypothetical protein ACIBCA_36985 [Kitasatospora sp. NPDC051170]|uniref:hypothetical protein n=1 Tax=Kitasatospora sp. NPDC051170 TaxID=3364056 RepID=UPI0037A1F867